LGLQSKMTVYAAIAGMLALMGGIVYYASLDNEELEKVEIELQEVEVTDVNNIENRAQLEVTFLVRNPSEKTFTVPSITYQLYGDGVLIGSGQYSTEDISMPGRAAFYPGAEIPLESKFFLSGSNTDSEIYESVVNNQIQNFKADGMITVETSWSLVEKEFEISN